ncbi:hypothetical protein Q763_12475 [Flavobacterium beibuense F44-8]|uniref:Uncharacterized protein n=1 Tax=Flavobacterium beibuense F44-8 TaxID=1406840 RepID=A0A0A2LU66_9FLAO|nr:hypothetical protein [Flavobacterium beibuense]KGO79660.1 hypothetical protein Q763_12475 [Flavobacterium beibuense F44-8]
MKTHLKYIGKNVSLQALKDVVTEKGLNTTHKLLLNPQDYNTVILEQANLFEEVQQIPLTVNGIVIEKDDDKEIPYGTVGIT